MRRLVEAFVLYSDALKELFFPRHCIVCGDALPAGQRDLCARCREDLPLTYFWDWVQNPAFERITKYVQIESAASLFFFREEAGYNHILHAIKYGGNTSLGYELGSEFGAFLLDSPGFAGIDAVVPVPLHRLRRFRRGYNQAEVIASGIASSLGIPLVTNIVQRVKRTGTQTRLHGSEKKKNVEGAFSANEFHAKKMAGNGTGHILLVDDVLTSGATLSECAKQLTPYFKVSVVSLSFVE
ncbi:MAG: ComF family protein [Bacteroidales bacterium]|nr:ComF family protein [Candidatus Cacconaster equi]